MYNYKTITPDSEITLKFERLSDKELRAIDKASGADCGVVTITEDGFEASDEIISTQYELWLKRPERKVGKLVKISGKTMEELIEAYEEILVGCYILNHPKEAITDGENTRYGAMLDWLRSTDFYTAPASTQYHESFPGGLLVHSLNVYNEAVLLHEAPQFKHVNITTISYCALVHDWCKIGLYEPYSRNVKNDKTGEWEKVTAYRHNLKGTPLGHGATSMFYASKFFNLSTEAALAIRWHMGEYNVANNEMNELHKANSTYPLCYLLQFADRLSCVEYKHLEDVPELNE